MKLSDGTIINSNIKFLGSVFKRGELHVFDFNGHIIRAGTREAAEDLRKEIIEKVPEAELPKQTKEWSDPPMDEVADGVVECK